MPNYFIAYDLNGPQPNHAQVDDHLKKMRSYRARVLETVWYAGYSGDKKALMNYVKQIFGKEDLLLATAAGCAT